MKVHGSHLDQNYWRERFVTRPVVHLDGVAIDHVVEADDDAGYVIVEVWKDGKPVTEVSQDGQHIKQSRLTGKVEIIGDRVQ